MLNSITNKLKVMELNVNSIVSLQRRADLDFFIKKHNPDILMLNETHLLTKYKLNFKNYNFIRRDKIDNTSTGTGVLIKKCIKHNMVEINDSLSNLENIIIRVHLSKQKFLYCVCVYINHNRHIDVVDFDKVFNALDLKSNYYIIGGDFNCRHTLLNDITSNNFGIKFVNWYINNNIQFNIHILKSTTPTFKNISFLDLFLINSSLFNISNHSIKTHSSFSDHNAIETLLDFSNSQYSISLENPQTFFNYSAASWKSFQFNIKLNSYYLNIPNDRNLSNEEIEINLKTVTDVMSKAISQSIPISRVNNWSNLNLPHNILVLIKQKSRLRKKLYRSILNNPFISIFYQSQLKSEINCLTNLIKQNINLHFNNKLKNKLEHIRTNNNSFTELNKFLKTGSNSIPHITNSDNITTNNTSSLNLLGEQFERVHSQNLNLGDHNFNNNIDSWISNYFNTPINKICNFSTFNTADSETPISNNLTTLSTLISVIKNLKNKKSSGDDGIPNLVLKKLPKFFLNQILILFNHISNNSFFPDQWKIGKIFPILKTSKPSNLCSSYRPISLLSCLSKVYERLLYNKLILHTEDNNIIPPFQFGFRHSHSTVHAVTKLLTDISFNLNNKNITTACLIDIEKAFDTVWINGLIWKMKNKYNFNDHIIHSLHNYLNNRTFYVSISNHKSKIFNIKSGVPQGGILSPLLFNIFISDIPNFNTFNSQILLYADDAIIYSSSPDYKGAEVNLNKTLNELDNYYKLWKININYSKCESIIFKPTYKNRTKASSIALKNPNIHIKNHKIATCKNVKYLGIVLNERLSLYQHTKHILNKSNLALIKLKTLLNPKNHLHVSVKQLLYKQLIRPNLTYAFPTWYNLTASNMEKLRIFERKCLRLCVKDPYWYDPVLDIHRTIPNSELYERANILRIDQYLLNLAIKYIDSSKIHESSIIKECFNLNDAYLERNVYSRYQCPGILQYIFNKNLLKSNNLLDFYNRSYVPYDKRHLLILRNVNNNELANNESLYRQVYIAYQFK